MRIYDFPINPFLDSINMFRELEIRNLKNKLEKVLINYKYSVSENYIS